MQLRTASDSAAAADAPVRVLYIGGCGRSGSTLLDVMLGQIDRFFSVGELRFIWQRGLVENQLCGCGLPFRDCPFWQAVGVEAFGGWDKVDEHEMVRLERSIDRHRFLPFVLAPWLSRRYGARLRRYTDVLAALYRAIETVAGCTCIVDSTKDPPYAFLLRRVPGLDVRLVHLVRDSRGVAFSWTKRVQKPEQVGTTAYMNTYHPVEMGFRWLVYNLLFHVLGRLRVPRMLMRYEQLVDSPRDEIGRVLAHLGEEARDGDFRFLNGDGVDLSVHHTVAGNPMRFTRGQLALRVDDAWKTQLDPVHKRLVSICTLPLLVVYGYLRPARARQ